MKIAYFVKNDSLLSDPRAEGLLKELREGGCALHRVHKGEVPAADTSVLLSFGGDGSFLDSTRIAAGAGIPVLGVNLGRMGFLSESSAEDIAGMLLSGSFSVEERAMVGVSLYGPDGSAFKPAGNFWPYALNEVSVMRSGAAMLGIDVSVGGEQLPTYWADGLLVSTSTGSTAYSLSVGGPVCTPDSEVLILAPVSPHNLNVRPIIVPLHTEIRITLRSRSAGSMLTLDNSVYNVPSDTVFKVGAAPLSAKRIAAGRSNFINALKTRLFWGEDVRNSTEQK